MGILAATLIAAAAEPPPLREGVPRSQFRAWDRVEGRWVAAIQSGLRSPLMDRAMTSLKPAGPAALYAVCAAAILAAAVRRKMRRRAAAKALAALMFAGIAADWFGSQVVKEVFDRPAPVRAWADVEGLTHGSKGGSFWSNHAATCFAGATVCVWLLGRRAAWAYLPAALIAFSRIYCGAHYPSDVAAGALFGVGLGALLGWMARREWNRESDGKVGPAGFEPAPNGL